MQKISAMKSSDVFFVGIIIIKTFSTQFFVSFTEINDYLKLAKSGVE